MKTKFKSFNPGRCEYKPYGFTCERWTPEIMPKIDRHNEIELNFIVAGSLTYFFKDKLITIPSGKIALFWGLVPHRIMAYENNEPYFVCTIPLALFLKWNLPSKMVNQILSGQILIENRDLTLTYDSYLFGCWEDNLYTNPDHLASILEIQARLLRFAENYVSISEYQESQSPIAHKLESMTLYIARNYTENITAQAIASAAGITPDYANVLFNKSFGLSLMQQVMIERINHAQRDLLFTDNPVSQIAMDCGFNSLSCFNAAFKKLNGCSPSEYKRACHIRSIRDYGPNIIEE